jgi:protein phosphatase
LLIASGFSHEGRVLKNNEDRFVADLELGLFAIADGMGGHNAGEVASGLAVEAITGFVGRSVSDSDFTWPYGVDETLSFDGNRLRTAIHLANRRIFQAAETSDDYNGMGTTIVGMIVNGSNAAIGNVGDSRLYLCSGGQLQQLSEDDSWGAILSHDPSIGAAELARHPLRHVLTSVLGGREEVDVHLSELALRDGDVVVLCSDGVHGSVDAEAMKRILESTPDVDLAARTLVNEAMEHGSRDNVTAIVVRYQSNNSSGQK